MGTPAPPTDPSPAPELVCTIFERDYHIGAAALINSLLTAGFTGRVVCAFRGDPPPWQSHALSLPVQVTFRCIDGDRHPTNVKPLVLRDELEADPTIERIYYFDPDIVVKAPWQYIARWTADAVSAVEDVNGRMPVGHPLRIQWRDFLSEQDWKVASPREVYVNAGYLGLHRDRRRVIDTWIAVLDAAEHEIGPLRGLKHGGPTSLFNSPDQDALNMALEIEDVDLRWAGGEAMDFLPGGSLMSHAIGTPKPWHGGAVGLGLRGMAPSRAWGEFLKHTTGPLPTVPEGQRARMVRELAVAGLVGRLWRRR